MIQKPSLGRIVHYRSRTGDYTLAAIVAATQADLYRPNVEAGFIPDLDSDMHVHLVCFTPGLPGAGQDPSKAFAAPFQETDEELIRRIKQAEEAGTEAPLPISLPASGTLQEWNIPYANPPEPGTWRWPPRSDA